MVYIKNFISNFNNFVEIFYTNTKKSSKSFTKKLNDFTITWSYKNNVVKFYNSLIIFLNNFTLFQRDQKNLNKK